MMPHERAPDRAGSPGDAGVLSWADTWSQVEDDFYVGSRNGEFLGYIDREETGAYVACDQFSRVRGTYDSLTDAIAALEAAPETPSEPVKVA